MNKKTVWMIVVVIILVAIIIVGASIIKNRNTTGFINDTSSGPSPAQGVIISQASDITNQSGNDTAYQYKVRLKDGLVLECASRQRLEQGDAVNITAGYTAGSMVDAELSGVNICTRA